MRFRLCSRLDTSPAVPDGHTFIINNKNNATTSYMTKIKTKVSINWSKFERRILIHCAVVTAAECNGLYQKRALSAGNRSNIKDKSHKGSNLAPS